jgi:sialic acid synthase SpsE
MQSEMPRTFSIGPHELSMRTPPVFLAEIGGFFGQDHALAREMIGRIIDAGRAVPHMPMILKTEVLHDVEICLPGDTLETYASKDGWVRQENYRSLIERKVLPLRHYAGLFEICRDAGMPFMVSVYDFTGADFAVEMGAASLKIASSNIVHVPLIRHCAAKGLPLVIDSGRASLAEVHHAVALARAEGCGDIVVEHSPDGHPALPKAHNLRILQTYLQAFDLPVGLSDHHVGLEMLYLALALGATVLEKGVHVAPDDLDIDISHTMGLADLPRTLQSMYDCWQALGKAARDPAAVIEGVIGTSQRQCVVAARDLAPGDRISLDTVRFAFPCRGIPVQHWDLVNGWVLTTRVSAGEPVQWGHVQQSPG